MKHKVSKIKIKLGKDANKMLLKKLFRNFTEHGFLTTTAVKASYLKPLVERLAHDALRGDQSSHNTIIAYLGTAKKTQSFVQEVKMRSINGTGSGIVKVVKLGQRPQDAAPVAKVTWTKETQPAKSSKRAPQSVSKS